MEGREQELKNALLVLTCRKKARGKNKGTDLQCESGKMQEPKKITIDISRSVVFCLEFPKSAWVLEKVMKVEETARVVMFGTLLLLFVHCAFVDHTLEYVRIFPIAAVQLNKPVI